MKRPAFMTMVMGHPLIGGPIALSAGFGLYASYGVSSGGGGLLCAVLLGGIGKAYQEAQAYRHWAKSWAAATADAPPRRPMKIAHLAALLILVAPIVAYAFYPDAVRAAAPGIAVLTAMGIAVVVIIRLLRRAVRWLRRRGDDKPFAVAMIARPTGPRPTLATAYQSLPPHCAAILRRRQ